MPDLRRAAVENFRAGFGRPPEAVEFAPGRVNLIGEHVDYNDGIVLPMPLPQGTVVALGLRNDERLAVEPAIGARYVEAARAVLAARGHSVSGLDVAIASDLPIGAGLSSSAALLVATLRTLAARLGIALTPRDIAALAHEAETRHVGVACGIMDQLACAVAKPGHALRIDCRDGSLTDVALPLDRVAIVVADSGTRRSLLHSAYNERVAECRRALALVRAERPAIVSLRDATLEDLDASVAGRDDIAFRRARHVVREIARVVAFSAALERGDFAAAGAALDESHASLRDDYEVSSPALDALQRELRALPGCFGARLTGAGFAGCVVALFARDAAPRGDLYTA
jgi:galactokinase